MVEQKLNTGDTNQNPLDHNQNTHYNNQNTVEETVNMKDNSQNMIRKINSRYKVSRKLQSINQIISNMQVRRIL